MKSLQVKFKDINPSSSITLTVGCEVADDLKNLIDELKVAHSEGPAKLVRNTNEPKILIRLGGIELYFDSPSKSLKLAFWRRQQ